MRKMLLAAAASIALVCQLSPVSADTQALPVGADGYTRAMWRGTDGTVVLWKLDASLAHSASHIYGPYEGWSLVSLTMLGNNTYLLWRYTDGTAVVWALDANLNFMVAQNFSPIGGWVPEGLSVSSSNVRLLWKTPGNEVNIWVMDAGLNLKSASPVYGSYIGFGF